MKLALILRIAVELLAVALIWVFHVDQIAFAAVRLLVERLT